MLHVVELLLYFKDCCNVLNRWEGASEVVLQPSYPILIIPVWIQARRNERYLR